MRYTKELQTNVCNDIKEGVSVNECASKYDIPVSVILKWNNLDIPVERAKEIAIRKYQVEVGETEADLTEKLANYFDKNISDDDYLSACDKVSKSLFALASKIIKKERDLSQVPDNGKQSDAQIVVEITNRWKDNKFIRMYAV